MAVVVKTHLPVQETSAKQVQSLDQEDPLEEGMAIHSSILSWRIPRTEEPGGLQFTGLQRVGHDRVASLHSVVLAKVLHLQEDS